MRALLLALALCTFLGCTTTPIQSMVQGQVFGDGEDNLLHQLKHIAYYSAVVRDPDITEQEFYDMLKSKTEEEYVEWVADKEYELRRFVNVLKLYASISEIGGQPIPELTEISNEIQKHYEDLKYAEYLYYGENVKLKE